MATLKLAKPFHLPPMPTLSELVKLYKLRAIRQLSQNFLLDSNINDKIIRTAGNIRNASIIEIGPGPGGLTRSCIEAGAKEIICIEKDLRFMEGLQRLTEAVKGQVKMKIFHGDALTFSMAKQINPDYQTDWESSQSKVHIIGNLPFNIATPLLFKLLLKISDQTGPFRFGRIPMTFLFQNEFGMRMIAPPGCNERSRVSVLCQSYCDVELKFIIPNTAFVPPPKVHAAVVRLLPLKEPRIKTKFDITSKVVKAIFQFKNKMWHKGFMTLFPEKYPEFKSKFNELCKVDPQKKPIDLDIIEINEICQAYSQIVDLFPDLFKYDFRYNPIPHIKRSDAEINY